MSDDDVPSDVPFGSDANGLLPSGGTGRLLVTLQHDKSASLHEGLRQLAGLRSMPSADHESAGETNASVRAGLAWPGREGEALVLESLGVALVHADPDRSSALREAAASTDPRIRSVEPEQYMRALAAGEGTPQPDLQTMTWGIHLTQAWRSPASGAGIRIAMLDTGFDLGHPDFAGRVIVAQSFVPGLPVHDRHGHGTHTTGTACGPRLPAGTARRYGVACDATLLVGKVLNDFGWCEEGWVLAGMDWALRNRADLISLSLGWHVSVGEAFKQAFEQAGRAALDAGCVVIAAAGNDGDEPVYRPANCPSIFAVGALDNAQHRADFSCLGLNAGGGEVDIAGPGVDVYSAAPMPARYRLMKGTSMATPHVTGCAALWAENHGVRGRALWELMQRWAVALHQSQQEVGVGMVQAPW